MATVTVDSTSQRYTSRVAQEPDILLLHTTEVWGWPGYNGGGTAPHDTIKPIPGVGIIVRRHYPYDQFSKSLENDSGGVETNKRGLIQAELMGTCDPRRKGEMYYWPEADDAVLSALADYYRPIMAKYGIPARAMAEFVAYPKSYGDRASQRLSFAEWMNGSGICGHQHAPENAHGDPGNFPIDRFIQFLLQKDDDMPTVNEVWTTDLTKTGRIGGNAVNESPLEILTRVARNVEYIAGLVKALDKAPEVAAEVVKALPAGTPVDEASLTKAFVAALTQLAKAGE